MNKRKQNFGYTLVICWNAKRQSRACSGIILFAMCLQELIQEPAKHLRWNSLEKHESAPEAATRGVL